MTLFLLRLLEADTKSLKSISSEGGRRNSGGSLSPTSNGKLCVWHRLVKFECALLCHFSNLWLKLLEEVGLLLLYIIIGVVKLVNQNAVSFPMLEFHKDSSVVVAYVYPPL